MSSTETFAMLVTDSVTANSGVRDSPTPAWGPTLQLSSDTLHPETASGPTGEGPLSTSDASDKLRLSPELLRSSCRSEVPMSPSGLRNLLEWLTEHRKPVYSLNYWFTAKDIKGYESAEMKRDVGQGSKQRRSLSLWSSRPAA